MWPIAHDQEFLHVFVLVWNTLQHLHSSETMSCAQHQCSAVVFKAAPSICQTCETCSARLAWRCFNAAIPKPGMLGVHDTGCLLQQGYDRHVCGTYRSTPAPLFSE